LGALTSGCSLAGSAVNTACTELTRSLNECTEHKRNRKLAEAAWDDFQNASPKAYGNDFACGFKDGFAEYLYAGPGDPPLPPHRYWATRYQTPEGYQAIEAWFAGY